MEEGKGTFVLLEDLRKMPFSLFQLYLKKLIPPGSFFNRLKIF
jgi:hypothetical protein